MSTQEPEPVVCQVCKGEVRIVSLTDAGATYACPCARTKWTQLSMGQLDVLEQAK